MPASAAARISDVPSGTRISWPSMVRVTVFSDTRAGVPRSRSRLITVSSMVASRVQAACAADCEDSMPKSCGKWFSADSTG
ncbi:hypothetical protein D3C73_861090 [compost metagenome]